MFQINTGYTKLKRKAVRGQCPYGVLVTCCPGGSPCIRYVHTSAVCAFGFYELLAVTTANLRLEYKTFLVS